LIGCDRSVDLTLSIQRSRIVHLLLKTAILSVQPAAIDIFRLGTEPRQKRPLIYRWRERHQGWRLFARDWCRPERLIFVQDIDFSLSRELCYF